MVMVVCAGDGGWRQSVAGWGMRAGKSTTAYSRSGGFSDSSMRACGGRFFSFKSWPTLVWTAVWLVDVLRRSPIVAGFRLKGRGLVEAGALVIRGRVRI